MSLGGASYSSQAACDAASAAFVNVFAQLDALGIATFVSTGNGASITNVEAPACVSGAIGVGSTGDAVFNFSFSVCTDVGAPDKVSCYSNTSPIRGPGQMVDLLAPGCHITAEWVGSSTATYATCGTSMATPMAAGIAASLLSAAPSSLSPTALEQLLKDTADPVVDYRNGVTYPRINAWQVFESVHGELPTPMNLVATTVSPASIQLIWDDVAGEDGYRVQHRNPNGGWVTIGFTGANETQFLATDADVSCGASRYRVRAENSVDGSYSVNSDIATATARTCLAAPTGLAVTSATSAEVRLTWHDQATGETGYRIERSANYGTWVEIDTQPANAQAYTDTGFACELFRYRVRAHETVAGFDDYSDYSNIVNASPCGPDNDLFENATLVGHSMVDDVPNIRHATSSGTDPAPSCRYDGSRPGSNSVWYRIAPTRPLSVTISTAGSTLGTGTSNDTTMAVYTGTEGSLTEVACSEDISSNNLLSTISALALQPGETYHVYVTRWSTVPMAADGTLRVGFSFAPIVTARSATDAVLLDWTAALEADAYRIERKPLIGGSFTQIAEVAAPGLAYSDGPSPPLACDVYQYRVRAFAAGDPLTEYSSAVVAEPLGCNLRPPHDEFDGARLMTAPAYGDATANIRYATINANDPQTSVMGGCSLGFPRHGSNSVWYKFTPEVDGLLSVDTVGSLSGIGNVLDTFLSVFTGAYGSLVQVACTDDIGGVGLTSALGDFPVVAGTTYHVYVARWDATPATDVHSYQVNMSFAAAPSAFDLNAPGDGSSFVLPSRPTQFDWADADGAHSYRLRIADATDADVVVVNAITASTYTLDSAQQALLSEGDYTWQVTASNANGGTAAGNGPFTFSLVNAPGDFTLSSPADGAQLSLPTAAAFSWTASSNADSYTLTIRDDSSDLLVLAGLTDTNHALTQAQTTALGMGTRYWQVRAINGNGHTDAGNGPFEFDLVKNTATVTLHDLAQTYDGTPRIVTATTVPAGLTVDLTYDGSLTAPTDAGSYAIEATVNDANYQGSASGTLVVSNGTATVTLDGLSQTYNGTPRIVTATTVPAGLTVDLTYDGSPTAPTDAGSYAIEATVNDANYQGRTTGTLIVDKATATVTLDDLAQTYDGTPRVVTATTVPAGLTVDLTYDGGLTAPTDTGSYAIVATVDDANYQGSASGTLVVSNDTATITLDGLNQTYDGTPRVVTATTVPVGLTVAITYDGSHTAPTDAGSYTIVATVNDANYQGSATGTLVVSNGTATVTLDGLSQTYDGTPRVVTATTVPAGLTVDLTYDGSPTAPTDAGSYAIEATVNDANYQGSASGTLVVDKATATVTLHDLTQTYDGTPRVVTATTTPAGLTVDLTYDGNPTAPTSVGSYAIEATVNDANYQGSATGTLVVTHGVAQAIQASGSVQFTGTPGEPLSGDLPSVRVTDGGGNPVPDVTVTFQADAGSGTLTGASVTTDTDGLATLGGWQLGISGASNTVTATAAGVSGSVQFTATGENVPGLSVSVTSTRQQYVQANHTLTHLVTLTNTGLLPEPAVELTTIMPDELDALTLSWLCVASAGSTCPAEGTGPLPEQVELAIDGSVIFVFSGVVRSGYSDTLELTITAEVAGASVSDSAMTQIVVMRDGFQLGGDGAESWIANTPEATWHDQALVIDRPLGVLPVSTSDGWTTPIRSRDGSLRVESLSLSDRRLLRVVATTASGERSSDWLNVSVTGAVELVLTNDEPSDSSELWLLSEEGEVFVRLDHAAETIPVQVQGEPVP